MTVRPDILISTSSFLDTTTVSDGLRSFGASIDKRARQAQELGFDGLQVQPTTLMAMQIKWGRLDRFTKSQIKASEQSFRTETVSDVWNGLKKSDLNPLKFWLTFPHLADSPLHLLRLNERVNKPILNVVYPPESSLSWGESVKLTDNLDELSNRLVQPTETLAKDWHCYSSYSFGRETLQSYGYDGIALNLTAFRQSSRLRGHNLRDSLKEILPFTKSVQLSFRTDLKNLTFNSSLELSDMLRRPDHVQPVLSDLPSLIQMIQESDFTGPWVVKVIASGIRQQGMSVEQGLDLIRSNLYKLLSV